jgi:hypothetical protein
VHPERDRRRLRAFGAVDVVVEQDVPDALGFQDPGCQRVVDVTGEDPDRVLASAAVPGAEDRELVLLVVALREVARAE